MDIINGAFRRLSNFLNIDRQVNYHSENVGSKETAYINIDDLGSVYKEIAHLMLVIDTCANMVSNGVWVHKINGKIQDNSKVLTLLNKPNFLQSNKEFLQMLSINEDIYGNAFIFKNYPLASSKLPYNLWVLPSSLVKVHKTGKLYRQTNISEVIEKYEIQELKENYLPNEVIHTRVSDANTIVSDSKISSLRVQVSNLKSAYDSRNVLINNRGVLGILSTATSTNKDGTMVSPMSPKEKENAERKMNTEYGSQKGQKKILITSLPVQWIPMSQKVSDLMLFEEVQDDFEVIVNSFGLKRDLFVNSTYENVSASQKLVYQDTIIPRANRYADEIKTGLGLQENETLELDFSHLDIMKENKLLKTQAFNSLVNSLQILNQLKPLTPQEIQNYLENGI